MDDHECVYRQQWEGINRSRNHWLGIANGFEKALREIIVLCEKGDREGIYHKALEATDFDQTRQESK